MENMWVDELSKVLDKPIALAHAAITGGHVQLLNYLVETKRVRVRKLICICSRGFVIGIAAQNGQLEMVKDLFANGNEAFSTDAVDGAALEGHFEIVTYLYQNQMEGSTQAMDNAAGNGHLDIVKWLHRNATEGCTTQAMNNAASSGHLDVVKWLHENRHEGCTIEAMNNAVASNHLEIVKWIYYNRTEKSPSIAIQRAANSARLSIVKFFLRENVALPCSLCNITAQTSNLDIYTCIFLHHVGVKKWFWHFIIQQGLRKRKRGSLD